MKNFQDYLLLQETVVVNDDEGKAIRSLDSQIRKELFRNGGKPISILVPDPRTNKPTFTFTNITGCVKIPGFPKADMALMDSTKKQICWISHKADGGARAFQQYSGCTEAAGKVISTHKEVLQFLKKVSRRIHNKKLTNPMLTPVKDARLINSAIYGPDFGSKSYSIQNVNFIAQGMPLLSPHGRNSFILSWSGGYHINGDTKSFTKDPQYLPVIGATYREGRGFHLNGVHYVGARIGIYPRILMQRSGLIEV